MEGRGQLDWAVCVYDMDEKVGKLIVSNYVAASINNWLQDVLATKAFISCVQLLLIDTMQLRKAFVAEMSSNQLLIDTAT